MSEPEYELFAIRYATREARRSETLALLGVDADAIEVA
jgi:hypothetical protein